MQLPQKIFVAGIGTNVGKTVVSAIICEALEADYWKPVQTGLDEGKDRDTIQNLISCSKTIIHPSAYELILPASPNIAADAENAEIKSEQLVFPKTNNKLIIEGAGGLMVPLNKEITTLDFIAEHTLDVVLVANDYLGCINHTLLSLLALKSRNISVLFGVFNGFTNEAVKKTIQNFSDCKWLNIESAKNVDRNFISSQAKKIKDELSAVG
jgi:dethiobiotin synthetase